MVLPRHEIRRNQSSALKLSYYTALYGRAVQLSKPGAYCPLSSKDELGETRFLIRSVLSGTMFKFFPCTLLLYNYVLVGLNKLLRWSR